jgi:hydrogenase maturation protease
MEQKRLIVGLGWEVVELGADPLGLISRLDGVADLVVLDAAELGAAPGEVRVVDLGAGGLVAADTGLSVHCFGLCEVLRMARDLNLLPQRVKLVAMEPSSLALMGGLSECARMNLEKMVEAVLQEVSDHGSQGAHH